MYVITLENHPSGIFFFDEDDDKIIPIFETQCDAERYISFLKMTQQILLCNLLR